MMSKTVKSVSVSYDAINENNTFSSGDFLSGRIILDVSNEAKINYLSVKAKGDADVYWTESSGDNEDSYSAHEKYFKLKQFIIPERRGHEQDHQALLNQNGDTFSNVVAPGTHVYPFTFQIPQGNMPSSFKGSSGKIIYTLEAKLSRSMRIASKAKTEVIFISRTDMDSPQLMTPQSGTMQKKMKFLTSGKVSMKVNIEKMGYMQGEHIKISAEIENASSRSLKPKFSLDQKLSFIATFRTKVEKKNIIKETGEPITSSGQQKITQVLSIPSDLSVSILNCTILKVEYELKVYLDVPYAKDPEIKFPIIILPASCEFGPVIKLNMPIGFEVFGNSPFNVPTPN